MNGMKCAITGKEPEPASACSCVACTAARESSIREAIMRGRAAADRIRRSGAFGAGDATTNRYR